MKTSILHTAGAVFAAGVLLTSCVSSKKYHRSQDEVAKLRSDSTQLAQQASSLQGNLNTSEQKNSELQKNVETANTANEGLKKNVGYYHDYADKQVAATDQMKSDIATTLSSAGLTEQDIMVKDGKIYINVGEKSLFKGNTALLTSKGKELVDNLGSFVKSHEAVDVSVADLQQAVSVDENGNPTSATTDNSTAGTTTMSNTTSSTGSDANGTKTSSTKSKNWSSTASTDNNTHKAVVHHKKKVTATSGESKSVAYSSGKKNKYTAERMNRSAARAMAWKRQNTVADALLKTGVPKVKVVAQNTPGAESSTAPKGVQVVLVNNMDEFYKHMTEAPAAGQPVSANP